MEQDVISDYLALLDAQREAIFAELAMLTLSIAGRRAHFYRAGSVDPPGGAGLSVLRHAGRRSQNAISPICSKLKALVQSAWASGSASASASPI